MFLKTIILSLLILKSLHNNAKNGAAYDITKQSGEQKQRSFRNLVYLISWLYFVGIFWIKIWLP